MLQIRCNAHVIHFSHIQEVHLGGSKTTVPYMSYVLSQNGLILHHSAMSGKNTNQQEINGDYSSITEHTFVLEES